jgi:hypothetical protein
MNLNLNLKLKHQPQNHGRRDSHHHHRNVPPRWGLLTPPQREIDTQKQRERTQSRLKPYTHLHIPSAHKKYHRGDRGSRHPHGSHRACTPRPTRLCRGCARAGPSWASGAHGPAQVSGGAQASRRACGSTRSHRPRGCDRGCPCR